MKLITAKKPIPEDGRTRAPFSSKSNSKQPFKLFGRNKAGSQQQQNGSIEKMQFEIMENSSISSLPPPPCRSCLSSSCFSSSLSRLENSDNVERKVTFDKLYIREHRRMLGDNPSVSVGPALSLDWYKEDDDDISDDGELFDPEYYLRCQEIIISLDDFENTRRPRRPRPPLVSRAKREKLLRDFGVSKAHIILAEKAAAAELEAVKKAESRKAFGGVMNLVKKSSNNSDTDRELLDLMKRASIAEDYNKKIIIAQQGSNLVRNKKTTITPTIPKPTQQQVYISVRDCPDLVTTTDKPQKSTPPLSDETNSTASHSTTSVSYDR